MEIKVTKSNYSLAKLREIIQNQRKRRWSLIDNEYYRYVGEKKQLKEIITSPGNTILTPSDIEFIMKRS